MNLVEFKKNMRIKVYPPFITFLYPHLFSSSNPFYLKCISVQLNVGCIYMPT